MIAPHEMTGVFAKLKEQASVSNAQVELTLNSGENFSATYQDRTLKKYTSATTQSAVIRVLHGTGVGIASTENLGAEALEQCFQEALLSAKDLDGGIQSGKILEDLVAPSEVYPQVPLFASDYQEISVPERLKWAETLEKEALDLDARVSSVPYSGVSLFSGQVWLLNSKGMNQTYRSSGISGYAYALAKEGEKTKSGHSSFFRRNADHLPLVEVAREGGQKAVGLLAAVQPKTGVFPTVLTNEVMASLLSILDTHLSAKSVDEGTSAFAGKVGETMFSTALEIIDNPLDANLPGSRPFDAEGTPSQLTPLFEKGKLQNFLTNSYYARKLKLPLTGSAVRGGSAMDISTSNMVVKPGNKTFEELVALAPEVVVITEATGFHSGMKELTGDFSLPAYGYMYRNGKRMEAIEQFVISGNVFEILKSVTALSNRVNTDGSSVVTPDMFVPALSLAGAN